MKRNVLLLLTVLLLILSVALTACSDGTVMNLYRGEVHSHTNESDGIGSITEAYTYARDVARLDFFAVTDHSSTITKDVLQKKHANAAEQFNDPGKFVALYGYEQTYNSMTGYYGHLNVLNTLYYYDKQVIM